ncbi:MAG: aminotransferase class V-fold PLP-dependent enzyme [bacterium]|nr:aminotransferase class V-fold PLP-dependent enzyme [bacterium]
MDITDLIADEETRNREFPVTGKRIFLGHAGVAPLPRIAVDRMTQFLQHASEDAQEDDWALGQVREARRLAAALLGCTTSEISLLGPTSLGLNLVAAGIDWDPGDQVVFYRDDYPANVYPWANLRTQGVTPVALHPEHPGAITWPVVEAALTDRTRLVALASCSFLSGYRIDIDTIGRNLHARGILFCVDGIQTVGAFPTSVEHVDFLSADSHKWMLGPAAAGIFYVDASARDNIRPALLGSWNVVSPEFVAQEEMRFEPGGRGFEPGMLNLPGIVGMAASMELLHDIGVDAIGERILELRRWFVDAIRPLGYGLYIEEVDADANTPDSTRSGIISVDHPRRSMRDLARALGEAGVSVSLRQNRLGRDLVRFSPHFYNTHEELDRVVSLMASA